jgi:hypothetical protein
MRPGTTALPGEPGTSRFPRMVLPRVPGVSDRAGLRCALPYRRTECCLPLSPTASASRRKIVTRLNTRPARSPVHASAPPLRVTPQDSGPLWVGRVRWWRGSGLRMMPTFPPPPLSFRTAGFPQYGWKVGRSDSVFPRAVQVKPAPGVPCTSRRFASAFRVLCGPTFYPALCQDGGPSGTPPCEELAPLPQRPSLRTGFYCPSPSLLIRPHPPHSQAHPVFAAWRFIPNAFAVLVRLGDPRAVPCFRCVLLLDMPSSSTPGGPSVAYAQFLHRRRWPSPRLERLGTPQYPIIRFRWDVIFEASWFTIRYLRSLRPVDLLAPLADLTGYLSQPTGAFTSGLSTGRSSFPPPDVATVATEQVPPVGLSPTGTAASIAAPNPSTYDFFIHYTMPVLTGAQEKDL